MEKVIKFANREELIQFCKENTDYKPMVIFSRTVDKKATAEKVYFAYNKRQCPPLNNALLEHWEREGLI
jgi:hypothetical protein